MDIQTERNLLIEEILKLQDITIIQRLKNFLKDEVSIDWYDGLSDSERNDIEKGLIDLEDGNFVSHEDVASIVSAKIASLKQ